MAQPVFIPSVTTQMSDTSCTRICGVSTTAAGGEQKAGKEVRERLKGNKGQKIQERG